jgi:hypothetical protein
MADAFLRVLNWNFRGGLKELRVVWSFSESALIAWRISSQLHMMAPGELTSP